MKIAVIYGTRPEAIKVASLIQSLQVSEYFESIVISTGQHRDMVRPLLKWFGFQPDIDLDLMRTNQTPQGLLANAIIALDSVFKKSQPDIVVVQGDTSTALAGAIAAFHHKIAVAHIEAGLRTGERYSPFPEEANRSLISKLASYHFAPTINAQKILQSEKVPGSVFMVGNTVVDALLWTSNRLKTPSQHAPRQILITTHRRENFGPPMQEALSAIAELATLYPNDKFVLPVHKNPQVRTLVYQILADQANIELIEPVEYPEMVRLIQSSYIILTDSGGIQEEAPTFGIPVLIMRESTERPEIVDAGIGTLVGTSKACILRHARDLLDNKSQHQAISKISNPYGDGRSAERILEILSKV